ncbi:hypothetical protein V520_23875 [Pseudomonas putida KG-4]|nr:hypothetical protein V520_23875 [Pseudomonas putida KG-4]
MHQAAGQASEAGAFALQALAEQTPLAAGRYRVQVVVNDTTPYTREIDIHNNDGQGLQACLTGELLRAFDLREEALDTPLPTDDSCVDLAVMVPQAQADFDPQRLHLALSIPQIALRRHTASVYQNVGNGSLSLTFSQDDYWGSTAQRRQYQVQYNTRWRDVSINLFASQALTDNTGDNRMFGLSLSLPLDFGRRHTASFDLQRYDGRYSERASLSGGMMNNQLGYQVSLSNDQQNNTSGALSLAHQGTNVSYGGGYTQGADYRSVSLNASGALLAHGSGIVLGPYMGETGALVHVPDVAGITLANTPSSQANRQGYLLASNLRPYRLNSLLLDTDELSPETIIDNATQQVVPRRGAIVKASFPSRQVMRMVLTLQQADGRPLPFGTQISDAQGNVLAVVGQAGQALVASDVPGLQQLHARWADQATRECQVTVNPGEIPQVNGYRLKTLTCQPRHAPSSTQTDMNHQEHTS